MGDQIYGWQRYLGIEQEFITARQYVSLEQDNTYSEFFTRAVIILGAEIEGAFKKICSNTNGSEPGNMGQYKEIILGTYPRIVNLSCSVRGSDRNLRSFEHWDNEKLSWWDVYANVKHSLLDEDATCIVALKMLAAYQLCLFIVEVTERSYSEKDYLRAYSAVDAPKLLIPGLSFATAQDDDGILNAAFNTNELIREIKK